MLAPTLAALGSGELTPLLRAVSAPILVGGQALYDLVAHADGALEGHPGSGPFNTARTVGRLRQPVAYLGRPVTDRLGS